MNACRFPMRSSTLDGVTRSPRCTILDQRVLARGVFGFGGRDDGSSHMICKDDIEGNAMLKRMSGSLRNVDFGQVESRLYPEMQGRGLVSSRALVLPGQRICSIPMEAVITSDYVIRHNQIVDESIKNLPEWTLLALYLADLLRTDRANDESYMELYSRLLPRDAFTVIQWSENDVELLKGSHLYSIASDIRHAADATIEEVEHVARDTGSQWLRDIIDSGLLPFTLSLVLSRVVRLESDEGVYVGQGLCPGMDFLNHSCSSQSFIRYDSRNDSVYVSSDRIYKKGEQVYISYGEKTNGELFLSYGFCPEDNIHDSCLFCMHAPPHVLPALAEYNIPQEMVFPLRLNGLPEGIIRYSALLSVENSPADIAAVCDLYKSLSSDAAVPYDDRKRALRWIMKSVKESSRGYAVSMDEAKQTPQVSRGSVRDTILMLLLQEHRIMNKVSYMAQQQLVQLK
jgi:hypothetical protein